MNITVYLGANEGNDPLLKEAVRELGTWIGSSGNTLIYGGSKNGLMGEVAESVLDAGGRAIGVEPQIFIDQGFEYDRLTELIVTKDMTERKTKMIELGDAFIAFPGGTGTLEEIAEVMSKVSLKFNHHNTMLEYFGFVAGTSLANPKVSCTVTVCEIFIKWSFFLQLSHAFTQFRLIARKKNRVNDSEIKFSYLVTIGAKAVFNCYFHASFDFYCTSIISSIRPYRTERSAVLSMV